MKREFGIQRVRFATSEVLLFETGLEPGSLPPFDEPIFPVRLFADTTIGTRNDRVAFNAGSLTLSIVMSASDWGRITQFVRFKFAKE